MMISIKRSIIRAVSVSLVLLTLIATLGGCSGKNEIPDGYQYATCNGEYFRLFVPTQWTVNTQSGVSSAYVSQTTENTVSMREVSFTPPEADGTDSKTAIEYFIEQHKSDISVLKDFKKVKEANTTMSGYRAWEIVYTATLSGKSYSFRQILSKVNGRYYVFTYSALEQYFDSVAEDVDGILAEILFFDSAYNGGEHKKIPSDVDIPVGMKLVSDNTVAFRFFAPESWVIDSKNSNCLVYFSESDRSNVSLLSYMPRDDSDTVDAFWKLCEAYYEDSLIDYVLLGEPTEVKLGGRDAIEYLYTYSIGGVNYKTMQVVTMYAGMAYSLTYTALPELFDIHMDDVLCMQEELIFRS